MHKWQRKLAGQKIAAGDLTRGCGSEGNKHGSKLAKRDKSIDINK